MTHVIENDFLKISAKGPGAELTSIVLKKTGNEYLWQADKAVWPRHAPVLFPIVGKLKDGMYQLEGRHYFLGQHGFARDKEFLMTEHTDSKITFRLTDDPYGQAKYPFGFVLEISYKLQEQAVLVSCKVKNRGVNEMYFSIGAHPAFSTEVMAGETMNDYILEFEKEETANRVVLADGLRTAETETFFVSGQRQYALSPAVFDKDALVFSGLKSKKISLKHATKGHGVTLETLTDAPYYGIWSAKGCSRFVCLEPWQGWADAVDAAGELSTKDGIMALAPEAEHVFSYLIHIHG